MYDQATGHPADLDDVEGLLSRAQSAARGLVQSAESRRDRMTSLVQILEATLAENDRLRQERDAANRLARETGEKALEITKAARLLAERHSQVVGMVTYLSEVMGNSARDVREDDAVIGSALSRAAAATRRAAGELPVPPAQSVAADVDGAVETIEGALALRPRFAGQERASEPSGFPRRRVPQAVLDDHERGAIAGLAEGFGKLAAGSQGGVR